MDISISYYFAKGLAPSTHKAYSSAQNQYLSFCTANQLQPIPLSEATLCQFVTELANSSLKHQSIKCYLSGIRLLQISAGLDDPFTHTMPRLKLVLRGVKRHQAECGTNSRRRLPITPSILRSAIGCPATHVMMCQCSGQHAAYASLVSFGQGTPSDSSYDPSCHLSPGDISSNDPSNPSVLRVNIKQSKTDPFRHGVYIIVGATGESLCPVAAVLHYLTIRGMEAGPLFCFSDGRALTRQRFVSPLSDLGLDTSLYSGHSFRIGAATTAAARGISDALIKTMGRWENMAYTTYTQTPVHQIAAVSRHLL